MASREHSGVRASLPPVDVDQAEGSGEGGLAASDGLGSADPPAGHCADSAHRFAAPGRLGLTRRAVLGAAVAVPVAAAAGEGSTKPLPRLLSQAAERKSAHREWITVLAAFCRAEADMEECGRRTSRASAGPQGRTFEEQEALDDEYALFVSAADAAMVRLLEAPAPDVGAMAVKIGLIARHRALELDGGEECLAWLEADARRLARAETERHPIS